MKIEKASNNSNLNKNLKSIFYIPNILTALRGILVYPLYLSGKNQDWFAVTFILLSGFITDILDGWVARKFQLFSKIGRFLDTLVDISYFTHMEI